MISVWYNYQNAVWRLNYSRTVEGKRIPTFAAKLAGIEAGPDHTFMPDYSTDPRTIPVIPASDILSGKFEPKAVRGKDIVIATTSETIGDVYFIPGWGKMGGAYVQIIGAETLKSGSPVYLGWIPALLIALSLCLAAIRSKSATARQPDSRRSDSPHCCSCPCRRRLHFCSSISPRRCSPSWWYRPLSDCAGGSSADW